MVDEAPPPVRAPEPDVITMSTPVERKGARWRVAIYGGLIAVATVIAFFVSLPGVSLCAFQAFFSRPCPGCGMTRSVVNLAQGDVLTSLRLHPLGIVLGVGLVASFFSATYGSIRGRDPAWRFLNVHGARASILFLVALIGIWIVRAFIVTDWSPNEIHRPFWTQFSDR